MLFLRRLHQTSALLATDIRKRGVFTPADIAQGGGGECVDDSEPVRSRRAQGDRQFGCSRAGVI